LQNSREKRGLVSNSWVPPRWRKKLFISMVTATSHFFAIGALCSHMHWRRYLSQKRFTFQKDSEALKYKDIN